MSELLTNVLHEIGQILLIPCMVVLFLLMIVSVWQPGDVLIEALMERKSHKMDGAKVRLSLSGKRRDEIKGILEKEYFPKSQKDSLLLLCDQAGGEEELSILAQSLLCAEEARCARSLRPTELVVKQGPMFGLLGTLIPQDPGIVALGMGDTATLASSMQGA